VILNVLHLTSHRWFCPNTTVPPQFKTELLYFQNVYFYNDKHINTVTSSLYLINQVPRHRTVQGGGGVTQCILNRGTRWRWEVTFISRRLCPWETPRGLTGWAQSRSELHEDRNICHCRESNPNSSAAQPVAPLHTDWAIKLSIKWSCFFFQTLRPINHTKPPHTEK
jgi:hypothetical protein